MLKKSPTASASLPVYTTTITALGIVAIVLALYNPPSDWTGIALFATIAALVELFSVELFSSTRGSHVSMSSAVTIASILVYGPSAGVITHLASGLMTALTTTFLQRERPQYSWMQRSAFNVGMFTVSAFLAGWVYVLTGGFVGQTALARNLFPLIAAASTDTLVNITLLIGVLTLQTRRGPWEIWKYDFQWSAPISIAAGIVGGGALAIAFELFGVLGVVVFLLPVLSMGYSQRMYVEHTRGYVKRLEQLNGDLEEANLNLLETLGMVVDAYDLYTYGHSVQVAVYASALAEKMNVPQKDQETIIKAALVHDIGKIGVMDSIISKPARLTDAEYNLVKRHPIIGAEIVGRMKGLQEIIPLVRHHHERWDGTGYPDGLERREIPLGARIIAVADALDALCSDRPYRPTCSFKEVKEEIVRSTATQFDPDVVAAYVALAQERGRDFFKNSAAIVDRRVLQEDMGHLSPEVKHFLKKSMAI